MEIQRKEIKRPEALDIEKFAALYEGIALQNLNHFTFRDNIVDLENVDTMVFQLGREKRSMTMRQFIMVGTVGKKRQRGYKKKSPIVRTHLIGKIARLFVLMTPGALRGVTLVLETSLLSVAKLVELGICKYNALGYGVIVDYVPEVAGDEVAGAGMGQADVRGVRCHPKITTTNRLRAMDERLGDIKTDISRLVSDIDELTYVVSGMFEQYDQFYREFGQWRIKQERKYKHLYAFACKMDKSLKGKNVIEKDATTNKAKIIVPRMFKLDLEPLAPKVLKNKDARIDYIKHAREHANTLREIVKHARAQRPLDSNLDSAYKYVKQIQEVLVYVTATCPSLAKPSDKFVAVTSLNKNKKVRFPEPTTSSNNTKK
ncbi:hypothetical protein Tco_1221814 [Tanacetum coccineum]